MNERAKKELITLARTMYDYQDLRKRTDNRLRLKADGTAMKTEFMDESFINEDSTIILVKKKTAEIEKALTKEIEKIVKSQPIWKEFFQNVRGCGPLMAAVCLSTFDINVATTRSKMYQFAGLNAGTVKGKKSVKITKDIDKSKIIREYENQKGEKCAIIQTDELIRGDKLTKGFVAPYNAWLRTKLCGVLGASMLKAQAGKNGKNYATEFYYPYKQRLETEKGWENTTPKHRHNAAIRYMIKMFLSDLYEAWRKLEGLEVRVSYPEEYLGKKHHE